MEGGPSQPFTPVAAVQLSEAQKLDRAEDLATSPHTQSCLDVSERVFLGGKGSHFKVTAWLQWFKCPLQSQRRWRVLIWLHCYHRWFLSALQSSPTKSRWWKNSPRGGRDKYSVMPMEVTFFGGLSVSLLLGHLTPCALSRHSVRQPRKEKQRKEKRRNSFKVSITPIYCPVQRGIMSGVNNNSLYSVVCVWERKSSFDGFQEACEWPNSRAGVSGGWCGDTGSLKPCHEKLVPK